MTRETISQLHTLMGIVVFITGLLQIILKKGGKTHRIVGQTYTYTWLILLLTGAYLGSAVVAVIGLFGYYFALTGARIGQIKTNPVTHFDKIVFSIGGFITLTLLGFALYLFMQGSTSFAIISAVFGLISLNTSVKDITKYVLGKPVTQQKYGKQDWFFEHLIRMNASFIAAVTAFTSIQDVFKNNTLNFLLPTVIGTVLITFTVRFYKKKLNIG